MMSCLVWDQILESFEARVGSPCQSQSEELARGGTPDMVGEPSPGRGAPLSASAGWVPLCFTRRIAGAAAFASQGC